MRRDRIARIFLGLVLVALAGFFAFFVKDAIDRRNPQYAVPQLTVLADNRAVSSTIGGFSWRFAFGDLVEQQPGSVYDLYMEENHLQGGERINLSFSVQPSSCSLRQSDAYSYRFMDIPLDEASVPYQSGGYTYEVLAEFPQGRVLYYFYIVVQ